MRFIEFKQQFKKYLIFSVRDIEKIYPGFNRINLISWQKKEYLQKLRNSWYCFTDIKTDETTLFFIANKIYKPSYISLESAFWYYGLIPEAVFKISSVTSLKTQIFKNNISFNTYNNIKKSCFFGYKLVQKDNYSFKIAELEKALSDFLYLRTDIKTSDDIESLRLNKDVLQKKLNLQKLADYAVFYNSKVLLKKIKKINQFINA